MNNRCAMCYAKDLVIAYQRQRLALLAREVERLKRIINQAKRICGKIASNAEEVMSQHQPRAKWAYAKAAKTAAQTIGNVLG